MKGIAWAPVRDAQQEGQYVNEEYLPPRVAFSSGLRSTTLGFEVGRLQVSQIIEKTYQGRVQVTVACRQVVSR